MGSLYGGWGNHVIAIGDVAVHPDNSSACLDGDPNTPCKPAIPFGTEITPLYDDSVGIPDSSGRTQFYSDFIVADMGDLDYRYQSGKWWVDVYFGRYRRSNEACSCWGVSGSSCTVASTNSCRNAQDFGVQQYSYMYYR